jgi:5-methylcytosine-specific restriction enzyme subunit McrC
VKDIPVANIWRMLVYAWDLYKPGMELQQTPDHIARCANATDLLASMLAEEAERIERRGLERGYRPERQSLACPRGRWDLAASVASGSLGSGRIVCDSDEFTGDTPLNRILIATIDRLLVQLGLDQRVRNRLVRIRPVFAVAVSRPLSTEDFRRAGIHRQAAGYRIAIVICELIWRLGVPDDRDGSARLRSLVDDDRLMARIWERFLLNFYRHHAPGFKPNQVRSITMPWPAEPLCPERADDLLLLPQMRLDVVLENDERTIIIDAKWYREALVSRGDVGGEERIRSAHLSQIMIYVRAYAARWPQRPIPSGALLYPESNRPVLGAVRSLGHVVGVHTVHLGANDWNLVQQYLLWCLDDV